MNTNNYFRGLLVENPPPPLEQALSEEAKYLKNTIPETAEILDIGCWDGRIISYIYQQKPQTKIKGIDNDVQAVLSATEKFKDNPNISITQAEANKLPFEDNTFDTITCMDIFHNLGTEQQAILAEMKRVVKVWGKIIITTYSEDAVEEKRNMYTSIALRYEEQDDWTFFFPDIQGSGNLSAQYTSTQLYDRFSSAGFEVENLEKKGIIYLCTLCTLWS